MITKMLFIAQIIHFMLRKRFLLHLMSYHPNNLWSKHPSVPIVSNNRRSTVGTSLPITSSITKEWLPNTCFRATICTSYCKYEIIRRIASSLGMREVGERDLWNLMWTDSFISVERAKEMRRFQVIHTNMCRRVKGTLGNF